MTKWRLHGIYPWLALKGGEKYTRRTRKRDKRDVTEGVKKRGRSRRTCSCSEEENMRRTYEKQERGKRVKSEESVARGASLSWWLIYGYVCHRELTKMGLRHFFLDGLARKRNTETSSIVRSFLRHRRENERNLVIHETLFPNESRHSLLKSYMWHVRCNASLFNIWSK